MNKKLTISNKNKILAGVCGGIGEYLNVDPTIIRILYVILYFCGKPITFLALYFILWIIMYSNKNEN